MEIIIKSYRIKTVVCVFVYLWINLIPLSAQTVIKATIDSTHILIGQQTKIHLEIASDKNKQLQIPLISDTLMAGVEVLEISKIDTTDIGNNRMRIKYDYLITSFDSALYLLPPFKVISGIDTTSSSELALKVSTLPVDTESGQFYDIKDIRKPPFVLMDYLVGALLILAIITFAALAVFLIYRLVKKKSLVPFKKEEPYIPPHIKAINRLNKIKSNKLWQTGKIKEYHSEITETLRKYIEERFGVGAMEMTSGEILADIKKHSDADIAYDNLKQILILADFVKFAKYTPLPDENELSMMNAYLFVNNTKIEELIEEKSEKSDENEENEKL